MESPSKKVRLEPDKKGYEDAMENFINTLVANPPRSMATTQMALTASADRRITREYGVEINILMTKLYGEERTKFGFDDAPETRHFALKVFGMVYEFGPFEEKIKKSHFLDWYANHLDFEFASTVDTSFEFALKPIRRPVVAYTMLNEQEFDARVQNIRNLGRPYDAKEVNCFCFIKTALMFSNRNASPDCEVQKWIAKYQEFVSPGVKKTLRKIRRNLHIFAGGNGTHHVVAQVDLIKQEDTTSNEQHKQQQPNQPQLMPGLSRKRPAVGNVIARVDLIDDDD